MNASNDLLGTFAHQAVVGGDVGFALHRIDDQLLYALVVAQVNFDAGREAGTAHAGDARVANYIDQFRRAFFGEIGNALVLNPLVFAIGIDDDTYGIHS